MREGGLRGEHLVKPEKQRAGWRVVIMRSAVPRSSNSNYFSTNYFLDYYAQFIPKSNKR